MGKDTQFESVVAAFRKMQSSASAGHIEVGRRAHIAIRKRLRGIRDAGPRRRARAEAVEDMRVAVLAAGFKTQAAELNRMVCLYHVAEVYGPADAKTLPLRSLRAFCSTLKRVPKDESWIIKPKIEDGSRALFGRAVAGDVQVDQVQAEVNTLLGRKPRVSKPKPKHAKFDRAVHIVNQLSREEQVTLFRLMQNKLAPQQPEQPKPSIPITTAPGRVAEVRKPSLKEKLGLRAG